MRGKVVRHAREFLVGQREGDGVHDMARRFACSKSLHRTNNRLLVNTGKPGNCLLAFCRAMTRCASGCDLNGLGVVCGCDGPSAEENETGRDQNSSGGSPVQFRGETTRVPAFSLRSQVTTRSCDNENTLPPSSSQTNSKGPVSVATKKNSKNGLAETASCRSTLNTTVPA